MVFASSLKNQEHVIRHVEADIQKQKRDYMRQLLEDNKRLEEYRARNKKDQDDKEKHLARNQVEFFDRHRSYR
jgi:hypothetical protein